MSKMVLLAIVISIYPAHIKAQDKTAAAGAAVQSIFSLYDSGKFGEIYDVKFHASMRQQMSREQWIEGATRIRAETGKLISRTAVNKTKSLGIYRFIFASQWTEGKVFEDLTVAEEGGDWKLMGFWVRPNLE